MNFASKGAVFLLAAIALLAPAAGSPDGEEDWTVITCDGNLFMDYENQRVVFFNNVRVENPRGRIRSDRLTVYFSPDGKTVEKTVGEGNVRFESEGRSGRSEQIVYYPAEKKAVLIGQATVASGGDSVGGGLITFYLDRNEMEVEESPTLEYIPEEEFDVDFKVDL